MFSLSPLPYSAHYYYPYISPLLLPSPPTPPIPPSLLTSTSSCFPHHSNYPYSLNLPPISTLPYPPDHLPRYPQPWLSVLLLFTLLSSPTTSSPTTLMTPTTPPTTLMTLATPLLP